MGNTDKKKSKKFRRKIRIRLADPNVPDSYVCEVFDSSLENEDDEYSKRNSSPEKEEESTSKPKNFFEVLMSQNCKKNGVISKVNEKYKVSDDSEIETFQKRRSRNTVKKNSLRQSVSTNRTENQYECNSSGNESPVKVQKKSKVEEIALDENSQNEKHLSQNEISNDDCISVFDSPKIELTGKKTLSILNYFSKTGNNSDKHQKSENPKICQQETNLKSDKNEPEKSSQSNKKVLLNGINKENQKLAPLFYKKEAKVVDLAKQKARLEFLYRGSPSSLKKSEIKNAESLFYFPKVTHVQQRNESVYWSRRDVNLPLERIFHSEWVFNESKKFSFDIAPLNVVNKIILDQKIDFNKELLNELKWKYVESDLDVVIEGLKDKRDKFLARVSKIQKSLKGSNEDVGFEELNALWTEKYKPKSNEILGSGNTVRKLKKWLQSWKSYDDELKLLVKSQSSKTEEDSNDDDDDDDDFLNLNGENYGLKAPGNVCIISGPNGCGKTALVYALANELEFGVLELNASSKRTGKTVLSNLQEATQSHKVHQVKLPENIVAKRGRKKRKSRKPRNSESFKRNDQTSNCKISLILIEDADVVYDDHDEGFYSAINSLVQTSKRPLIFLTNEPNCPYLENLKLDQCLVLEMEHPNFYKSCAVLDVVSCLEGVRFDKKLLECLICQNGFDLRKSLLELQFWSGSGKGIENFHQRFDLGHLWWGLSKFLFKKDIKHSTTTKVPAVKRKRTHDLFDSSEDEAETTTKKFKSDPENCCPVKPDAPAKISDTSIESYFQVLDLASTLDGFGVTGNGEPVPGNECRPKDSLALDENLEEVAWCRKLNEEISSEILSLSVRIFSKKVKEEEDAERKLDFSFPSWEEIRWRNSQAKASEELSSLVSLQRGRDKRSLHLDYLPILRNICRVERHRADFNPKRKNRFFHYLNSLKPDFSEENLETNCEVFERN